MRLRRYAVNGSGGTAATSRIGWTGRLPLVRIGVVGNYSLAEARRLYDEGGYPEQNLYGALALERAGHDVRYPVDRPHRRLSRIARLARGRLGDLAAQREVLRTSPDLVFAAVEEVATALALAGRTPVSVLYHQPPAQDRLSLRVARRASVTFALSRVAQQRLQTMRPDGPSELLAWGPQLDFGPYREATSSERVVSIGKSGRDVDLLAAVLVETALPGTVYAPAGWTSPSRAITVRTVDRIRPYPEVLADLRRARVVAIPLVRTDRMLGLTELNDALALAKPVVMTRSPHIDVPIETIACGFLVEPGDRRGWAEALRALHADPDRAAAMGRAGRAWAEQHWNARLFGEQIVRALAPLRPPELLQPERRAG